MAQSLVFLGAGASQPFGIPTMQQLVSEFEEEIKKSNKPSVRLYSKIRTIQQKWYKNKNVDIESIFSVIDGLTKNNIPEDFGHLPLYLMADKNAVNKISIQDQKDAKELKSQLEAFIKQKSVPTLHDEEIIKIYEETYSPLFSNLTTLGKQKFPHEHTLNVGWKAYTTNYDTIFEGFWGDFARVNDFFEIEQHSTHQVFTKEKDVSDQCIIKLHGSINWLKRKIDNQIMKKGDAPTRHQTSGEVMIFPIQQKDLYLYPWIYQFLHFKQALEETAEWVIVGYAFNDEFILNIFKEALTSAKHLIIINPQAEHLKQLFPKELHEQISILPIKFGGKYFKPQLEDFRKSVRKLTISIQSKSGNVVLETNVGKISNHDSGNFETSTVHIQDTKQSLDLRSSDVNNKQAYFELTLPFKHNENKFDFEIFTNAKESVSLTVKYQDKDITHYTTPSIKHTRSQGYHTIKTIYLKDLFIN